jgi:photosystem II stability/assembly factor-like uncharacterized protein
VSVIQLETVYEVPSRTDEDNTVWYRCLSDMHFVNSRVGWVVGSGQVLRTQDGGGTWANQYRNYASQGHLNPNRVFAINPKTCWIIALGGAIDIRCSYTPDGGKTWGGKEIKTELHPNDIFFVDSKRGWIVSDNGHWPAYGGMIHLTNDGGDSWESRNLGVNGKPVLIRFIGVKKGWLLEEYLNKDQTRTLSNIYMTDDGGYSWRLINGFDWSISDLYIFNENRILATGEGGFIAKTMDGGRNWKRLETRSRAIVNSVAFYNGRRGLAASGSNHLLMSDDCGETWDRINNLKNYPGAIKGRFTSESTGILMSTTSIYSFKMS